MKYYATIEGGYADRFVDRGNDYLGKPPEKFDMNTLGGFKYVEMLESDIDIIIRRVYEKGEVINLFTHDYHETNECAIGIY